MQLRHYLYRNPAALTIATIALTAAGLFQPLGLAAQRGDRRDPRDRQQATIAPPSPKKNEKGPRAIAVVEWQADSRGRATPKLHPVVILDGGRYYDANLYRATPVPMALEYGTVYEAQDAGEILGYFTIKRPARISTKSDADRDPDSATDDRPWFAIGDWKTASPKLDRFSNRPQHAEVVRRGIDTINGPIVDENAPSADDRTPNKERTTVYDEQGKEQPASPDDGKPTLKKRGAEGTPRVAPSASGSSKSTSANPPDDPDRPKLKRPASGNGDSGASGQTSPSGSASPSATTSTAPASASSTQPNANSNSQSASSTPEKDSDQPVLRHSRGGEQVKVDSGDARSPASASGGSAKTASAKTSPGDTVPQRVIDRGTRELGDEAELTLHLRTYEAVAVSDARVVDVPPVYRHKWQADEEAAVTQKMTALANSEVQNFLQSQSIKAAPVTPTPAANPIPKTKSPAAKGATARRTATAPTQPTGPRFEGVHLSAIDASSNSSEMIFSAREKLQSNRWLYVTVVARMDVNGNPRKLLSNVTTSDRLDTAPRLEFIDAVDADGDGRAEFLFRAIRDGYAEFVLYRVGPDKLEEIFHGGEA